MWRSGCRGGDADTQKAAGLRSQVVRMVIIEISEIFTLPPPPMMLENSRLYRLPLQSAVALCGGLGIHIISTM